MVPAACPEHPASMLPRPHWSAIQRTAGQRYRHAEGEKLSRIKVVTLGPRQRPRQRITAQTGPAWRCTKRRADKPTARRSEDHRQQCGQAQKALRRIERVADSGRAIVDRFDGLAFATQARLSLRNAASAGSSPANCQ